jgi:copper chaperone CopZ
MTKKIFRITDMHCPSCPMRLEGIEDTLTGIYKIKASYQKQNLEVEFDEAKVSEEQIRGAIMKLGYTIG